MPNLDLCQDSLDGLSVGDALGAQFFVPGTSFAELVAGRAPEPPWPWTDDTEMACSVVAELSSRGESTRTASQRLSLLDMSRTAVMARGRSCCFGRSATALTGGRCRPVPSTARARWGTVPRCGSLRSGRTTPDLSPAALEAMRSAEVTHAHPAGILGAAAVAVAASEAGRSRLAGSLPDPAALLKAVIGVVGPAGQVAAGLRQARTLLGATVPEAAYELGNGARTRAQDTVPFTIWVAATYLDDYPGAIRACIEAGGDVDTTAAIAGGIVATFTGRPGIPPTWLSAREPLPPAF